MPLASAESYAEMLRTARQRGFALPGVAVSSSETLNAALRGFADAGSDGIVQVSPSAARFASGTAVGSALKGALALAAYAEAVADEYPVQIALHTDHCPVSQLESFLIPLLNESSRHQAKHGRPLFNSQMFDGSNLPINQNLDISARLLEQASAANIVLEIEVGVLATSTSRDSFDNDTTFTQPDEFVSVVRRLGLGERGLYLFAPAFGNVHGIAPAGRRAIDTDVLRRGQEAVRLETGSSQSLYLTFHGGSGCTDDVIRESIKNGVVKFNIDTDTQYAYSGAVAEYTQKYHSQIVGRNDVSPVKSVFDSRTYGKNAEISMAAKVQSICESVLSVGQSIFR